MTLSVPKARAPLLLAGRCGGPPPT